MIYQIGRLVVGDNWKNLRSWWGQYVADKWHAGVLVYKPEERNLYFFEARINGETKTFVFNIDTTHFELVRRGKMNYYYLVYIKDKNGNEYLFNSDISFYGRSQSDVGYAMSKQNVYNQSIVTVINQLKEEKELK